MIKLAAIFAVSLVLAYCSQNEILVFRFGNNKKIDFSLIALIIMLACFCGLRTNYNDTSTYITSYKKALTVREYLDTNPTITGNPAFYFTESFFRHHISGNANVFLLSIASFSLSAILIFIRRHSSNFVYSLILFFSFGLYISHFASMKQCLSIAFLTFAIEFLIKKRYLWFFVFVFIAMLFHTYAALLIILPIFTEKPWTFITYVSIAGIIFTLLTFESTISNLLSYAEDIGKNYTTEIVLDGTGINIFRLAIFAIPPIISFIFQEYCSDGYDRKSSIFMNMSILTALVMCLGLQNSANLFARASFYFEIGTMISFPWFLQQIFDKYTTRFISIVSAACYIVFFFVSNMNFAGEYRAMSIIDFVKSLIQ